MIDLLAAAKPTSEGDGLGLLEWITLGVAAYAAVVSTAVAAYQFVRDKPGVKVRIMPIGSVQMNGVIDLWRIRIVNHRKRPITIRGAGLIQSDRSRLHPIFTNLRGGQPKLAALPLVITDGMDVDLYVDRDASEEIRGAWASDSLDHEYTVAFPSRRPIRRFKEWRTRRDLEKLKRQREDREVRRGSKPSPPGASKD